MSDKYQLSYHQITKENLAKAVKVQNEIFPNENGKQNFIDSINGVDYRQELIFWLVYLDQTPIGIIGLYAYHKYSKDAWMGWYGILPEYRGKGYGSAIFDFFEQAARGKGYQNIRLYTDSVDNLEATKLYIKKGMISEEYAHPQDIVHSVGKLLIFSKSLIDEPVEKWNNRYLGLKEQEKRQNLFDR